MNDLVRRIHAANKEKGFWKDDRHPLAIHMLIVSEIAEATEAVQNNKLDYYVENGKPEGEAVELMDALIRILDYVGFKGWDAEKLIEEKLAYNASRPYRHGNKKF